MCTRVSNVGQERTRVHGQGACQSESKLGSDRWGEGEVGRGDAVVGLQ